MNAMLLFAVNWTRAKRAPFCHLIVQPIRRVMGVASVAIARYKQVCAIYACVMNMGCVQKTVTNQTSSSSSLPVEVPLRKPSNKELAIDEPSGRGKDEGFIRCVESDSDERAVLGLQVD